jgi:hypothetical protein
MYIVHRVLAILLVLTVFVARARCVDAEKTFTLDSGNYVFHTILAKVPAVRGDIEFNSQLKITDEPGGKKLIVMTARPSDPHLAFHTKNDAEFRGVLKSNLIKLYTSLVADDDKGNYDISSIHFVGELVSDDEAKGTLTVMVNGEIAEHGDWTLKKTNLSDADSKGH